MTTYYCWKIEHEDNYYYGEVPTDYSFPELFKTIEGALKDLKGNLPDNVPERERDAQTINLFLEDGDYVLAIEYRTCRGYIGKCVVKER